MERCAGGRMHMVGMANVRVIKANVRMGILKQKKNGTDEDINDTLRNDELTPKEQMFCILYSRTFNATQSYLKTHDCSYNTANTEGYKLLIKPCIKKEIERLKEIKRQQIVAGADDIVEIQMRIAFADMGSYVSFDRNGVFLQQSDQVDTQLVQEVKQGQHGISIKLADRQKAIDWLSKYFLLHPEDKYRAEYDRKRAEAGNAGTEQMLQNIQTIADILQCPSENRSLENFEGKEEVNDEQTGAAE